MVQAFPQPLDAFTRGFQGSFLPIYQLATKAKEKAEEQKLLAEKRESDKQMKIAEIGISALKLPNPRVRRQALGILAGKLSGGDKALANHIVTSITNLSDEEQAVMAKDLSDWRTSVLGGHKPSPELQASIDLYSRAFMSGEKSIDDLMKASEHLSKRAGEEQAAGLLKSPGSGAETAQPSLGAPPGAAPARRPAPDAARMLERPDERLEDYTRTVRALGETERWVLPAPIADGLGQLTNPRKTIEALKFLDQLQALWKGSVTNVWPGFHIRNLIGAVHQNASAGITGLDPYLGAIQIQRAASKWYGVGGPEIPEAARVGISPEGKVVPLGTADSIPVDEFLDVLRRRGALNSNYFGEDLLSLAGSDMPLGASKVEQISEALTGGLLMRPIGAVTAAGARKLGQAIGWGERYPRVVDAYQRATRKLNFAFLGRVAGNTIEDNVRLAHALGRMELGDTLDQAIESVKRYHFDYGDLSPSEVNIRRFVMPFYCVDSETEVLSQRGWLTREQVHVGDKIFTFNTASATAEWQIVDGIFLAQDYAGEMVSIRGKRGRGLDALVTPDHKWPVTSSYRSGKRWKGHNYLGREHTTYLLKETRHLNTSDRIPLAAPLADDTGGPYCDALVEIVGWVVTEGHYKKNHGTTIEISQSRTANPDKVRRIRDALDRLGARYHEFDAGLDREIRYFGLTGEWSRRIRDLLPDKRLTMPFLLDLSTSQKALLINTLVAADGCMMHENQTFVTGDSAASDAFQALCAMSGRPTKTSVRQSRCGLPGSDQKTAPIWTTTVKRVRHANVKDQQRATVPYEGIVWCPHTVNETFLARRNGRVYFTGNTWTRRNMPLQLERLATEPRQAATISKVANYLQSDESLSDEERAMFGNYILERFGLVIGRDEEGNPRVVNGIGLPIEDISDLFKRTPRRTLDNWLGWLGPLQKMALELVTNHSTFTGRAIDDESYQNAYRSIYPSVAQLPGLRDWLMITEQKVTTRQGEEKTYYNVDPWRMYLLTNVLGRLYYSVGKATDDRKSWQDRLLNLATGAKITSVDIDRAAAATLRGEWTFAQGRVLDERNTRLNTMAAGVLKARGVEQEVGSRQAYRRVRTEAMRDAATRLDLLQTQAEAKQAEGSQARAAALKTLRDPVERALTEYYALTPEDPTFADEYGAPNMPAFFKARDAFLARLDPAIRTQVKARQLSYLDRLPPDAARVEREYQSALSTYRTYQSLPPFALPVSALDLEAMKGLYRRYLAYPDQVARARFITGLAASDRLLLQQYLTLRTRPSPQRLAYERAHPELQRWGFAR